MTGSSGLIGRALCRELEGAGWTVHRLVRSGGSPHAIVWNRSAGTIDLRDEAPFDAVVHLAGEPLATGRWTRAKKRRILDSREQGTRTLCEALARMPRPPACLLSASAVGYYGSCDEAVLDESKGPGDGFLAEVCRRWEAATAPASEAGLRVAHLRIGIVLSRAGGALRSMLPAFRLGLGGRLGPGTQFVSWISLPDVVGATRHLLERRDCSGPFNLTAPKPVTNAEFTAALARHLRRPARAPVPAFVLRLLVGEMADEALLSSTRAIPRRLLESGYRFVWPDLDQALADALADEPVR